MFVNLAQSGIVGAERSGTLAAVHSKHPLDGIESEYVKYKDMV
jgi:hypothetical protein